jgi:hypothetical protein
MLPIRIGDIVADHVFLISPQLLTQAPLGVDFCRMNNSITNFSEQCFTMDRDGKVSRHHFAYDNNVRSIGTGDLGPTHNSTKTDIKSMQTSANSMTDRATADYPRYNLRSGAVREVNVVPRSGSKNDNKECPIGERASGDNDNCITFDPEQVTRGRLNACCCSHATIVDRNGDSRGEEVMNNFDVCTAKFGRYEKRYVGDAEPAPDTHNTNTDDRTINTDKTHELKNLAAHQSADQRLSRIKETLNKYPNEVDPNGKQQFRLWRFVLFTKFSPLPLTNTTEKHSR